MIQLNSTLKLASVAGLLALGTTFSFSALAQGNGTSGGGQGVYQNGRLKLRDLVDPGTCRWQSGETLLNSLPELQARLEKVKALNWYFELMLRREIKSIDFCWTNAEINQSASAMYQNGIDEGSILIYQTVQNTVPVGLRVRDAHEVYVQASRFQEFGPQEQALFIIHEALHSFMPSGMDPKSYYEHLFSIVRTIATITGEPSEISSFEVALRKSSLNVPSSAQFFTDQKFLSYLLESYDGRREMILNHKISMEELLRVRTFDYQQRLPYGDQARVDYAKSNLHDELFQQFCMVQDEEVLKVLRSQATSKFDIDLYCLTSPGAIERIIDHPASLENGVVKRFTRNFYGGLSQITPSIKKDRVVVSKELDWISGNPAIKPKFRYALEVKSPYIVMNQDQAELHLLQYTRILIAAAKIKSPNSWLEMVKQDGMFLQAFNFTRLETELKALNSPIAGESKASIANLRAVYESVFVGIADRLRATDCDEHADLLVKFVNQSNLGFKLTEE